MAIKTRPNAISTDPATDYAQAVVDGGIVAGPHVRNACRRHLNDLVHGHERGLYWDVSEVERVIGFFRDVLTVEIEQRVEGEMVSEVVPFELAPSQCFIVGSLFGWKKNGLRRFRRGYIEEGKGAGKALDIDTPIPTPSGWSKMGDLRAGDRVFDDHGAPCNVTAVSDVMHDRPCYRVTFSDGAEIIADEQHLWRTAALRSGGKKGPKPADAPRKGGYAIRTTGQIADTLALSSSSKHPQAKWNHRVDIAGALDLPEANLPIPPYTLGAWLGDGDSDCARLTTAYSDWRIIEEIEKDGFSAVERKRHSETTARVLIGSNGRSQAGRNGSFQAKLRAAGLLKNKHIPDAYFRASAAQRMALLQGLIDTDGSLLKDGAAEFTSCRQRLADDVVALLRTLGFKPTMTESAAMVNGRAVGRRWRIRVHAYDDCPIARLPRKVIRQNAAPETRSLSLGRMIVGCDRIPSVPVRCISVDSPSRMFLAGTGLVPTHNSPLAAGIGHYMLVATGKIRAEVYSAATDKDQAAILFRDAVEMWRRSPALYRRLLPSGVNPVWQLTYMDTASFFKPITSEKKGKSGIRPYCALIDEVHEHPDNSVIEMLRAGQKGNRQALLLEITNSGYDRNSACWADHDYSIKVASGDMENDAWFSYVCALDPEDDPFADETCWVKANPLLGVSIHRDFIADQVTEAKGMPSKEALVRRLHFCQWTDAADGWLTRDIWLACEREELRIEDFQGRPCYGGLDLSYTTDLSALAWVFPDDEGGFDAFLDFWKPKEGLNAQAKRDRVPYDLWAKQGFIRLTDGKVIKLAPIADRLNEIKQLTLLEALAFDRYRHKELADDLLDLDIELPMIEHPQGFRRIKDSELWMPGSVQAMENAIIEGRLRVHVNPVLRWNISSVVIRHDPAGTDNRIFDKRKSLARIDGATALAMAIGIAARPPEDEASIYETRGIRTL